MGHVLGILLPSRIQTTSSPPPLYWAAERPGNQCIETRICSEFILSLRVSFFCWINTLWTSWTKRGHEEHLRKRKTNWKKKNTYMKARRPFFSFAMCELKEKSHQELFFYFPFFCHFFFFFRLSSFSVIISVSISFFLFI